MPTHVTSTRMQRIAEETSSGAMRMHEKTMRSRGRAVRPFCMSLEVIWRLIVRQSVPSSSSWESSLSRAPTSAHSITRSIAAARVAAALSSRCSTALGSVERRSSGVMRYCSALRVMT